MAPAAAQRIADPVGFAFGVLRESYLHSLQVLASDRETAGARDLAETPEDDRYDDEYYTRLYEREALGAWPPGSALRLRHRLAVAERVGGRGPPRPRRVLPRPLRRARRRAILVSLDGAAASVLDDAVARGVMPNLADLRAPGRHRARLAHDPCRPRPRLAHAALYTGAWSDRNGIAGNEVAAARGGHHRRARADTARCT